MIPDEVWKPIPDLEGYEVSNLGRVRSFRILSTWHDPKGYLVASAAHRTLYVSRAMLAAFTRPPLPGEVARHKNDVPDDNRLENLEWGTRSENIDDAHRNGRHVNRHKTHCPQDHEYTPENTYMKKNSQGRYSRVCKQCHKNYGKKAVP